MSAPSAMLQEIILIGMLARPAPPELGAKLRAVARALNVGDEIINAIERFGATLMRGEGCRTLVRSVSWPLNSIDWR